MVVLVYVLRSIREKTWIRDGKSPPSDVPTLLDVNIFSTLWVLFCDDTLLVWPTHFTSTCLIISTSVSGFLLFPEWLLKTPACILAFWSYSGNRKLYLFLFYGRFLPMWFFSITSIYIETEYGEKSWLFEWLTPKPAIFTTNWDTTLSTVDQNPREWYENNKHLNGIQNAGGSALTVVKKCWTASGWIFPLKSTQEITVLRCLEYLKATFHGSKLISQF